MLVGVHVLKGEYDLLQKWPCHIEGNIIIHDLLDRINVINLRQIYCALFTYIAIVVDSLGWFQNTLLQNDCTETKKMRNQMKIPRSMCLFHILRCWKSDTLERIVCLWRWKWFLKLLLKLLPFNKKHVIKIFVLLYLFWKYKHAEILFFKCFFNAYERCKVVEK